MKEEELDWRVYHILVADPGRDEDELKNALGCSIETLRESLQRLESAMLIDRTPEGVRPLAVQDMLLRCQARYDRSCPFTLEGRVIRMKRDPEAEE